MVKYLVEEADKLIVEAAFSVPKKRFKLAIDRNSLKRRIREAHRHHLPSLKKFFTKQKLRISIIYIYTFNQKLDYRQIERSVVKFIKELEIKNKELTKE